MGFHRLAIPTYEGGLPASGYDYINNAAVGTPAPNSAAQSGGTWDGTYFCVPTEFAYATNHNRANFALAENTDFIDDIVNTSLPVMAYEDFVAGGGGDASIQITGDVFVGKVSTTDTQPNRDLLIALIHSTTLDEVVDSGAKIQISDINDSGDAANVIGTEATGYHTNPVIHFNTTIPAATTYRLVYLTRGTHRSRADSSSSGQMGDWMGNLIRSAHKTSSRTLLHMDGTADKHADTALTAALYAGISIILSAGTVNSQLHQCANLLAGLAATNTFTNTNIFQAQLTLNTVAPFPVVMTTGLLATVASGNDVVWDLANGSFFINLDTDNEALAFRDVTDKLIGYYARGAGNKITFMLGGDDGVADTYSSNPHTIQTSSVLSSEALSLDIGPGNSNGVDGPFLSLHPGGGGNGAGSSSAITGHLAFNLNRNEGEGQYRTIVPTASMALPDGGGTQNLLTATGGLKSFGRLPPNTSSIIVEAYVFAHGWNAGASQDRYGQWHIRALARRNDAGGFLLTSGPTEIDSNSGLQDSVGTLVVTLVANSSGVHIAVTPPTDAGTQDSLWWGYLVISAFTFTEFPDFDLT